MDPPVDGVPIRYVLRSVHRHGVQLALRLGRLDQHQRSTAHLPTSAPFRAQPQGWYPASYPRRSTEGSTMSPRVSCRLSTTGIRLLGILLPPRSSAPLTVGLPSSQRLDPTGFPRSAHPSHGRIGCPLYPEAQRCSHDRSDPSGRRSPPFQGPGPLTPVLIPSPGLSITRRHQGFTRVHPPGLPPRLVIPWMDQGPLGSSPGFAPPQAGPAAHARAGDGHRALARSYTTDIVGPPIRELARDVRPRVARSGWT